MVDLSKITGLAEADAAIAEAVAHVESLRVRHVAAAEAEAARRARAERSLREELAKADKAVADVNERIANVKGRRRELELLNQRRGYRSLDRWPRQDADEYLRQIPATLRELEGRLAPHLARKDDVACRLAAITAGAPDPEARNLESERRAAAIEVGRLRAHRETLLRAVETAKAQHIADAKAALDEYRRMRRRAKVYGRKGKVEKAAEATRAAEAAKARLEQLTQGGVA